MAWTACARRSTNRGTPPLYRHELYVQNALALFEEGYVEPCVLSLRKALKFVPSADTYRLLAEILIEEKRHDEAIEVIQEAVERYPEDPEMHHMAGLALALAKRPYDAVRAFVKACELAPHDPDPLHSLGTCLENVGDFKPSPGRVPALPRDAAPPPPCWPTPPTGSSDSRDARGGPESLPPPHAGVRNKILTSRAFRNGPVQVTMGTEFPTGETRRCERCNRCRPSVAGVSKGYTDFLESVPARGQAAEAPPTEPQDSVADSYVTPTSRRIESPVSLITLEKGLDEMARSHRGAGQSPVRLDTRTGQVDLAAEVRTRPLPQGQEVLPLRLGALQKSLHRISEGDPFLLGSNPHLLCRPPGTGPRRLRQPGGLHHRSPWHGDVASGQPRVTGPPESSVQVLAIPGGQAPNGTVSSPLARRAGRRTSWKSK